MRILITGATGFVGRHVLKMLQADFQEAELLSPSSKALNFQVMLDEESYLPFLHDVDIVINCVGIIVERRPSQTFATLHDQAPSALFRACERCGVKKVIQISALGADANAQTSYHQSKRSADDVLRSLSLQWFVLQPSLIYGEGGASTLLFQCLTRFPMWVLPDSGKQMIQPIHISDVVATVKRCLQTETQGKITLPLVGNNALSFVDWLQAIRQTSGRKPASVLSISSKKALFVGRLFKSFMPLLHPDNLQMLFRGNTADVSAIIKFLGRAPLSTNEMLKRG